jgi:hypothetical protein
MGSAATIPRVASSVICYATLSWLRFLSFRLIPILQSLTAPNPTGTKKNQTCGQPCKGQERMRANLTPGSDHCLGQNGKPSLTLESGNKHHFFRRVIILIKTTRRLKGAPSAEQESSTRQKARQAHRRSYKRFCQSEPPRQPSLEPRHTTTADRTSPNSAQSRLNGRGVRQCVGIHKK